MRYLLTTEPGIEDIAAAECVEIAGAEGTTVEPELHPGALTIEATALGRLRALTTINHIVELRSEGTAQSLDDVRRLAADAELPELREAASFRVTTERVGEHDFHSEDVQRAAGAVLHRRYATSVDLDNPDVEIHANLHGNHLVVGLQRTEKSLGKRLHRARALRSSLKPTLAAAMLRLVGAHRGEGRLLDPMCGAGTIPVEASRINPLLQVFASDWDRETVDVARRTLELHGVQAEIRVADARALDDVHAEPFDYLVTDPPYGVRQAKRTSLGALFGALLPSFESVLAPGGRVALVVVKYRTFVRVLADTRLAITHERCVDLGGVQPRLLVLARR